MAPCNSPAAPASEIRGVRDKMLRGVCNLGDKGRECGQMEAPRRPPGQDPQATARVPLAGFVSTPHSGLSLPMSLLFGSCRYLPS